MLYEKIANYIIQNIESGAIIPGEKLPSLRTIAHKFGVSNPTAIEAYRMLEYLGYTISKERSGFIAILPEQGDSKLLTKISSNISEIKHVDEIVQLYSKSKNASFAQFGVGVPAEEYFPNTLLKKHSHKILRSNPTCFSSYALPEGRLDLRDEISKWILPWAGINSPEEIHITNGCLEAINLALSVFCKSKDIVAVESPCYFGMIQALKVKNLRAIEVHTDPQEGIDPESLDKILNRHNIKVLISTSNAQNPLGFSMSDQRKKEILRICKKHGTRIIENDVYGDVTFNTKRPKTYKYFDQHNIVTYCCSFSKTLGPSVRIGWCIPSDNFELFLKRKTSSNISSSDFNQLLVTSILKEEDILRITRKSAKAYEENVAAYSVLLKRFMNGNIALSKPSGGWLLWANVEGIDALKIFELALKNKIAITPGPLFSASGQHRSSFRINCGSKLDEKTIKDLSKLSEILTESRKDSLV